MSHWNQVETCFCDITGIHWCVYQRITLSCWYPGVGITSGRMTSDILVVLWHQDILIGVALISVISCNNMSFQKVRLKQVLWIVTSNLQCFIPLEMMKGSLCQVVSLTWWGLPFHLIFDKWMTTYLLPGFHSKFKFRQDFVAFYFENVTVSFVVPSFYFPVDRNVWNKTGLICTCFYNFDLTWKYY